MKNPVKHALCGLIFAPTKTKRKRRVPSREPRESSEIPGTQANTKGSTIKAQNT